MKLNYAIVHAISLKLTWTLATGFFVSYCIVAFFLFFLILHIFHYTPRDVVNVLGTDFYERLKIEQKRETKREFPVAGIKLTSFTPDMWYCKLGSFGLGNWVAELMTEFLDVLKSFTFFQLIGVWSSPLNRWRWTLMKPVPAVQFQFHNYLPIFHYFHILKVCRYSSLFYIPRSRTCCRLSVRAVHFESSPC